ncbi:MAG: lipoyl(octanoyl) transferase LipB [Candidatus Omnitrophica bacterium]|nr:lipoyl(octanoyl) transferase LipB [Candidatus Omnitrophota bacterium]
MDLRIFDLGLINYFTCWQIQKEIFKAVKFELFESSLVICRHNPVITAGRNTIFGNILASEEKLQELGIQTYGIERGGDVTYHGPGQLTVYPIFNLILFKKDLHWFLRQLEESVINFLSDFGIIGERHSGLTGVWADGKKICSIGIAVKNWITFHGLSLNIKKDDLQNFNLIRPCGLDIEMTSLEGLLNRTIEIDEIKNNLILKVRDTLSPNQRISFEPINRVFPYVFGDSLIIGGKDD